MGVKRINDAYLKINETRINFSFTWHVEVLHSVVKVNICFALNRR